MTGLISGDLGGHAWGPPATDPPIVNGKFPEILKISRIVPGYKRGAIDNLSNYKSISVLNFNENIFEELLFDQVTSFLGSNKHIQATLEKNRQKLLHMCNIFWLIRSFRLLRSRLWWCPIVYKVHTSCQRCIKEMGAY